MRRVSFPLLVSLAVTLTTAPQSCQAFSPSAFADVLVRVPVPLSSRLFINQHAPPALLPPHIGGSKYKSTALLSAADDESDKPSIGASIMSLAVPALAGLAIDPLMTIADTAFIGRTAASADALAGVGSSAAILTFSFYVTNFLCTATTPLLSRARAAGDEDRAVAVGGQALSLAIVLGLTLTAGLIVLCQPLLDVMGTGVTGPDANAYATSFLVIRALAAPAVLSISAATGILRGYLDTKTPLYVLAAANLVNFGLDVILILGADLGPTGAAIATTTAEWLSAITFLGVLAGKLPSADGELGSNQEARGALRSSSSADAKAVVPIFSIPPWESVKPLIVASSSVFLRSFVLQASLSGAAAMAARNVGNDAVGASASIAAHQIALQLWLLCSFVCDALAAASQALVADAIGREDARDTKEISNTIFTYSVALGGILAGLLSIGFLSGFLLDFFTTDGTTKTALNELLPLLILAQPLNAFVFAADGVLQGASEFTYQAKTMALSVFAAVSTFIILENDYLGFGSSDGSFQGADTLQHVWEALIVLQVARGFTSLVKLVQRDGPINLLGLSSKV
jgi:putative MATE family efflux protein